MRLNRRRALIVSLALALTGLGLWRVGDMAERRALTLAAASTETALRLTVNALEGDLARYEAMPQLLAELDSVRALAAAPDDMARRRAIDALLAARNADLQSSDIYLMRADGETIAASNHDRADSFVGQNFSYRPYFSDAFAGRPARFYALGTTSGVRGYYFSAPVRDDTGRVAGVIAVKIGVDRIESSWAGGEYRIFVTDPEGIVFMSSDPALRYGAIGPLSADRLARTEASRRYADAVLRPLDYRESRSGGVVLAHLAGPAGRRDYVVARQEMPDAGWTVHVLADSAGPRAGAMLATAAFGLALCVAGSVVMVLMQRRARVAERLAIEARAKADLERRVKARTADLARVNAHLEQEIAERRATEAELRAAQAGLMQVGKLAALGQMSATLSHEINQPLAAARNYADSASVLLDRGDTARARENIAQILALIDRMTAIGRHLRDAARAPDDRAGPVRLAALVAETQVIVAERLAASGAVLELDLPETLPPVRAGATRLQQVLVNLVSNAADAVEGGADRRITLSARVEGDRVAIRIRDRGPGVPAAIAGRIFDPFFTTKGMGAGLGLGLSISGNIVRGFGGDITLRDAAPGAEFCVSLPVCAPAGVAA